MRVRPIESTHSAEPSKAIAKRAVIVSALAGSNLLLCLLLSSELYCLAKICLSRLTINQDQNKPFLLWPTV